MKIAIVGLGLIGGSLAKDLKTLHFADEIVGVEGNPTHGKKALELKLVDKVVSLKEATQNSDLIILATPVDQILKLLPEILDEIGAKTVVTDMGSTKDEMCRLVLNHPKRKNYVAAHPMAGTENSGPEAAFSGLFTDKAAVICDKEKSSPEALKRVEEMFTALQMRLVYMESRKHDLHAAYVSHLSHISSFVLAHTVLDQEKNTATIFDLASGGFESTVRLAKSSPAMWSPIFSQNKKFVSQALSAYIDHLKAFRKSIDDDDFEGTSKFMTEANSIRRVLKKMGKKS